MLRSGSSDAQLRSCDVLMAALAHDPQPLRTFLLNQQGHELLDALVAQLIGGGDSGMPEQVRQGATRRCGASVSAAPLLARNDCRCTPAVMHCFWLLPAPVSEAGRR